MSNNAPFFVDNEVITLTRNGIWIADGHEITHEPTRKLFAKSLKKEEKGYFLHIGRETKHINVEDTAYFIHRIDGNPDEGYKIWLSDDTQERLDPQSLSYRPGRLTCKIQPKTPTGADRASPKEEAKFLHAAYFDLLKDIEEQSQGYYLNIQDQKIYLAPKATS